MTKGETMDVQLTNEESSYVLAALRTYCSELRMEIVDTDNPQYKRDLRHEREMIENVLERLDKAGQEAATTDAGDIVGMRFIAVWTTD